MRNNNTEEVIDMYKPVLLTAREAAEFLGISYAAFNAGKKKGIYPEPVKISESRIMWNVADLVKWIENGGAKTSKVGKK